MAYYKLVGSQDPASRIDRVEVESPSKESPSGKVLLLNGDSVDLSDEQYQRLSTFVRLEPGDAPGEEAPLVDQPGVQLVSQSTDNPPDPGTTPPLDDMTKDELVAEADREGVAVDPKDKKADIKAKLEKGE